MQAGGTQTEYHSGVKGCPGHRRLQESNSCAVWTKAVCTTPRCGRRPSTQKAVVTCLLGRQCRQLHCRLCEPHPAQCCWQCSQPTPQHPACCHWYPLHLHRQPRQHHRLPHQLHNSMQCNADAPSQCEQQHVFPCIIHQADIGFSCSSARQQHGHCQELSYC